MWHSLLKVIFYYEKRPTSTLYIEVSFKFYVFYVLDVTCFQGFFNFPDMTPILKQCCVYHVNAPGQEQNAAQLPEG